jgi:carbonic anhydrase
LKGDALIKRVTQEKVRHTMQLIVARSVLVRQCYEAGKVQLAGGVYQLREGTIEWLKLPEALPHLPSGQEATHQTSFEQP